MTKPKKASTPKKPEKKLLQARIPDDEHADLAMLCHVHGQTVASRLHMLVAQDLESSYPTLQVNAPGGLAATVRAVITKRAVPMMTEVFLTVPKANATKAFGPAVMTEGARFEMPLRTPLVYSLGWSMQDVNGNWHLRLLERKEPKTKS